MIGGTGGGRTQALLLESLLELLFLDELAGGLHGPQQASLGIGFRWHGFSSSNERLMRAALAGTKPGQLLLVLVLPVLLVLVALLAGVKRGPTRIEHAHPSGLEWHAVANSGHSGHLLEAGRVKSRDQPRDDGIVDLVLER